MEKELGLELAFGTQDFAGMSKREYAAIKLRVPDSGVEWLDEMIKKANRKDAACAAMQGLLSNADWTKSAKIPDDYDEYVTRVAIASCEFADELLKQENE